MIRKYLSLKTIKLLAITAVCVLIALFNPGGFFSPVRGFLFSISIPFQKVFYQTGDRFSEFAYFFSSIGDIRRENESLLHENNDLKAELADISQEKSENASLREQLNLLPRNKFDLTGGFVVGQDSQGMESWVIINKGQNDGIGMDMPAIVFNGIMVGKVSEVYANSAKINLLSDANSAINVLDVETGARGIVHGEYGLGMVIDMVTQAESLQVGDTLVTSGLGGGVPKGLLIGKIKDLKGSQDRLFQGAIVSPSIKYSKLDTVFVITNGQSHD